MTSITARLAATLTALAVVVALAACGSGEERSDAAPQTTDTPVISGEPAGYNSEDLSFVTSMIPHHEQAIALSKLVPGRSDNPELVTLADQIAATQQPEINIMRVFLVQWNENPETNTDDHTGHEQSMPGMVDDATMARLESLQGAEFDTLWLQSMIAHHEGAVQMAEAEVERGENVDAIAIARTMVSAQEAEIGQMKQMLEGTP
ncbi:DUF305 domain-containing protein, partial [Mycolicibacterium sp.]|uniref:DUF305 domain-containing protein n=1 Tax=Mycolicibacterium sp. TaxID=2320850 RepID=UPI003D152CC1